MDDVSGDTSSKKDEKVLQTINVREMQNPSEEFINTVGRAEEITSELQAMGDF